MPLLIDTDFRTAELVKAVNHLLALGGPRAITLRAVASVSRVSGSSIIHHLGSMEHLLRVSAYHTARARQQRIRSRWHAEGLAAYLPSSPDEVVDARTWLAWCELWRSEEGLEATIREAREDERAILAGQLDFALDRDDLDALIALVDGLLVATCRPRNPMSPRRAVDLLRRRHPGLGEAGEDRLTTLS